MQVKVGWDGGTSWKGRFDGVVGGDEKVGGDRNVVDNGNIDRDGKVRGYGMPCDAS